MGLPQIIIDFKAKGVSAIRRSARGTVLLLISSPQLFPNGGVFRYNSLEESIPNKHPEVEQAMLKGCFDNNAKRVIVAYLVRAVSVINMAATTALILKEEFQWLAVCNSDFPGTALVPLIDQLRKSGRNVKAVTPTRDTIDHEAIIQVAECLDLSINGTAQYTHVLIPIVSAILANIPLGETVTYRRLPEVTSMLPNTDPNAAIDSGKLVIIKDSIGYKIARGVTSLKTLAPGQSPQMKKIKVLDAVDTIREDIKATLEENYIGKIPNNYDSKLLLAGAIQGYFEGLGPSVLDKSYENKVSISLDGQANYLKSHGINIDEMSETEILKANTGSSVFLEANVRFVDAIEDITFSLSM